MSEQPISELRVKPRALREPELVMRLSRLGSLHQCRLSFMRQLTRRIARENWRFERSRFDVDAHGEGCALYVAHGPERSYTLVAFAHDLPPEQRSDRVIATAWDATFTLFDGIPTEADITRLRANVPLQEAGRVSAREISLSRANRSVRLWDHVVSALASGQQPDAEMMASVGYLMRTTAVYGSGKFGAADRQMIESRSEMQAPFQAEMLSVLLTRWFVRDLVEHMARAKGGETAVPLDPALAEGLGIGNSTGLGMAPFLINHPVLLNNWINAREMALARVRNVAEAEPEHTALFQTLLTRVEKQLPMWRSEHPHQRAKINALAEDVAALHDRLNEAGLTGAHPWDALYLWAEGALSEEGQELLVSLMLEPYGDLVDDLGAGMADLSRAPKPLPRGLSVGAMAEILRKEYGWALDLDWAAPAENARAWYVSAEKLEPRLAERFAEDVEDYEQPLAPGRDAALALAALEAWPEGASLAAFLMRHPKHRHILRRAAVLADHPYAEIRSNTIAADMLPIDMLRAKLSFFGVTGFDPRSDRWVRVNMYAGAPYPQALTAQNADFWVYPEATT